MKPVTEDDLNVPRGVTRVLDVFEAVLAEHSCNLTRAAAAADLTPSTALRYLRALEARGYVGRDTAGDFSAGPTILRIAASLRTSSLLDRLAATAQPQLDALAQTTGESAYLAISDGRTGTYVATAGSPRAIRHVGWVGQDVTLNGSALGAAFETKGVVAVRTGAVEPDITAMSCALDLDATVGIALSIVGPTHRFGTVELQAHEGVLLQAVRTLTHELRVAREDFAS
jgi:IclR family transcriptional regulator, acetate operon repressor